MKKKENILKDPYHWFGWVISTLMVLVVATLISLKFYMTQYYSIISGLSIFTTIVVVDYFKHKWRLQ